MGRAVSSVVSGFPRAPPGSGPPATPSCRPTLAVVRLAVDGQGAPAAPDCRKPRDTRDRCNAPARLAPRTLAPIPGPRRGCGRVAHCRGSGARARRRAVAGRCRVEPAARIRHRACVLPDGILRRRRSLRSQRRPSLGSPRRAVPPHLAPPLHRGHPPCPANAARARPAWLAPTSVVGAPLDLPVWRCVAPPRRQDTVRARSSVG